MASGSTTENLAMDRVEAITQLRSLWSVLSDDLDAAVAYGRIGNTPYAQRALVRAHFALIEGMSYQLRQVTLASLHGTKLLSEAEQALLREERYSIDDQGRSNTSEQFLKFPHSLLFSIRTYIKIHGATFEADTTHPGWLAMRNATKIRNRLTHPKSAASLGLSDEDLQSFVDAASWWKMTILAMLEACKEADDYWFEQLDGSK